MLYSEPYWNVRMFQIQISYYPMASLSQLVSEGMLKDDHFVEWNEWNVLRKLDSEKVCVEEEFEWWSLREEMNEWMLMMHSLNDLRRGPGKMVSKRKEFPAFFNIHLHLHVRPSLEAFFLSLIHNMNIFTMNIYTAVDITHLHFTLETWWGN